MSKILGIDYGSVRIGIALSDETKKIAFGREAIRNDKDSIKRLLNIIKEESVIDIILGYPLSLKGEKTQQTLSVEAFENDLRSSLTSSGFDAVNIIRQDERFTSKMAADSMLSSGMKKKKRQDKSNIDIISAAIILQSYLDSRNR